MAALRKHGFFWRTICQMNLRLKSERDAKRHYSNSENNIEIMFNHYEDIQLTPLRVHYSEFGQSFSDAQMGVSQYYVDKEKNIVNPKYVIYPENKNMTGFYLDFMSLFEELKDYNSYLKLVKEDEFSPASSGGNRQSYLLQAFRSLSSFYKIKEHHENCLSDMVENKVDKEYSELDITDLLANHLFSPLISCAPGIDNCEVINDSNLKRNRCLCTGPCDIITRYGNTGFGSEYLFFGSPDILLYPAGGGSMAIYRPNNFQQEEDNRCPECTESPNIDMKNTWDGLRSDKNVQQIVSQTITFSFIQNQYQRQNNLNPITTLIPSVFASSHYFDIYLYDTENDILLRNLGDPIPFFQRLHDGKRLGCESFESKFNLNSVVQLWMLINHLSLHLKLRSEQVDVLANTCGMRSHIDNSNLMDKIRRTLIFQKDFALKPIEEYPAFRMNKV